MGGGIDGNGGRNTWRDAISKAMKRRAVSLQCKGCDRKNAISKHRDALGTDRVCRYCGYASHYSSLSGTLTVVNPGDPEKQKRRKRK